MTDLHKLRWILSDIYLRSKTHHDAMNLAYEAISLLDKIEGERSVDATGWAEAAFDARNFWTDLFNGSDIDG